MSEYKEILGNAALFKEEPIVPIFCKPKLLPLKTVTMEKMEKMQRDAIEKLKALEPTVEDENEEAKGPEIVTGPENGSEKEEKKADIWSADG